MTATVYARADGVQIIVAFSRGPCDDIRTSTRPPGDHHTATQPARGWLALSRPCFSCLLTGRVRRSGDRGDWRGRKMRGRTNGSRFHERWRRQSWISRLPRVYVADASAVRSLSFALRFAGVGRGSPMGNNKKRNGRIEVVVEYLRHLLFKLSPLW